MSVPAPLRALLVNENLGGHATMHRALRRFLPDDGRIDATFCDVAPVGRVRRVLAARIPGLGPRDLDLQPLRAQLALSAVARRALDHRRRPVDAVHVYTQNAALFSTGTLRAVPSVVSTDATTTQGGRMLPYREPGPGTDARIRLSRRFEQRVYRAATIVVAKSRWVARSLREDYGVPDDKLRVIRFGIALPPPPDIDLGAEERAELTFIGARMDRKGGRRLLDLHQRRLRDRATLNLVTRDPVPDLPGVNVFADYRPGDPRLGALLARTDLLVQPSHIDTFGYALLEAMAVGVPTVSLDVGGCAETVEDGVTGVVLPEDAPDRDLAVAIEGLLDHPERRAAMGAAGRRRVETHFDARRTTVQLADTLLEAATTERPEAKAGPC